MSEYKTVESFSLDEGDDWIMHVFKNSESKHY